jgi:hypothetical protein
MINPTSAADRHFPVPAGYSSALAFGGFFDGIVLHQVLERCASPAHRSFLWPDQDRRAAPSMAAIFISSMRRWPTAIAWACISRKA